MTGTQGYDRKRVEGDLDAITGCHMRGKKMTVTKGPRYRSRGI